MPTVKFQLRRDTASNWTSVNPTLGPGEPALETDTLKVKYGNGANAWNSLPYAAIDLPAILAAYASGDMPSAFTLSIVDSVDAAAWRSSLSAASALRSISTGTGLVGGGNLSVDRTLSLATSGVTSGSYGSVIKIPTLTVDAYGRVTIASENAIPALDSGTYTPTLTPVLNVASTGATTGRYIRVGNQVTVSGQCFVTPTATGEVRFDIDLPIASNFPSNGDASGAGAVTSAASTIPRAALVFCNPTTDKIRLLFNAVDTTAQTIGYSLTYTII